MVAQYDGNTTITMYQHLNNSAHYFPFMSGRYEVKAGLSKLETDFGNGAIDQKVFQLDNQWIDFRRQKLASRRERISKYVMTRAMGQDAETALTQWLINQILLEYPDWFHRHERSDAGFSLQCVLSGEELIFDSRLRLIQVDGSKPVSPPYVSALDALACQVQEDLALVCLDDEGIDRICALHLCLPNHWSGEENIGSSFVRTHSVVPGMEKISRQSPALLNMLCQQGRYVRFGWGLATDQRLNHHVQAPPGADPVDWRGRSFDPLAPGLYVRVERQVLVSLPSVRSFVFLIRTYLEDVAQFSADQIRRLIGAIESMGEDTLGYKGIAENKHQILSWLAQQAAQ